MTFSIVYVLTNPVMPNLVKIGRTGSEDARARVDQLYSTGVPLPFKIEFACRVQNADEVERALHRAFAPNRLNPKREFFSIEADQAISILKLLHVEDATNELNAAPTSIEPQEVEAATQYASRRPSYNFLELGIPVGSVLVFNDGRTTVTTVGPKKVRFNDEELSLTAVTRQLLQVDYSVAPGPYWTYEGRRLREIYNQTYPVSD